MATTMKNHSFFLFEIYAWNVLCLRARKRDVLTRMKKIRRGQQQKKQQNVYDNTDDKNILIEKS